jgi:uncharacterized protein YbjQ (UPF0145 family)
MPVHPQWVTTGLEFEGHRIVGHRGVVRGITVRSRNIIVNLGAAIQTLFGGNIRSTPSSASGPARRPST